jgi:hypothetical protein
MSRGPGHLERAILSLTPGKALLVGQIARRAYRVAAAVDVTAVQRQATRRALRKLEQTGAVKRIYDEMLGRWRWQRIDPREASRARRLAARTLAQQRGEARRMGQPGGDNRFRCVDCRRDTAKIGHIYMLRTDVWAMTGLAPEGGMLCLDDAEARIGRPLTEADFSWAGLGDWGVHHWLNDPKSRRPPKRG